MAIFPTLTPSSRTFTPGRHPHSEIPTLNGLQIRVRNSNVIIEQRLRLTFIGLTEAQMLSIRSHYIGQQGRFLSFAIPTSLLSGMATPAAFTPTGYSWIYANAPRVEDIPCAQRYNVTVELVTEPPEGAIVNGAEFTINISFQGGEVGNSASAVGAALTVAASIEGGLVADNSSPGLDLTVSASLAAGAAEGLAAVDPDFSSVSLLLHMDGSNGSTTFTDSSSNTLSAARAGNTVISTTQSKFGGASAFFDGANDALAYPTTALFGFGTGDFCVEFWAYFANTAYAHLTDFRATSGGAEYFLLRHENNKLFMYSPGGTVQGASLISLNTWHHVALTRSGSTVRIFLNGNIDGTGTNANDFGSSRPLTIGAVPVTYTSGLNGYIDDLRITKGAVRYTANFTPPTAAFPDA